MGFFTRLIAGLVAASTLGAGLAGTAGAVDTTGTTGDAKGVVKLASDDTSNLPDHLVNGDFKTNYRDQWVDSFDNWTSIDPNTGKTLHVTNMDQDSNTWKWTGINGWNRSQFGWTSTQKAGGSIQQKANAVELQYDDAADNVYAELCAYEAGTAIYQDIRTVPGTLYKVRLKHASLNQNYLDKMQVLIGAPGHETPVEMTRTTVNGHGDKLNEKSTTIATKVTNGNNRHHESQWETYEGTYLIPDGQTTTRFTFRSIDAKQLDRGNVLDDIVFDKAYRLSYDKNASDASGQVPSNERGRENTVQPAKAKTTGTVKTVADENVRYGSLAKTNGSVRLASDDDVAAYAASNLPEQIVNGGFDYPSVPSWTALGESGSNKYNKGKLFATINPGTGKYGSGCAMSTTGRAIPNWNRLNFAWNSTQGDTHYSGGMSCEAGNVELNYDSVHHNQFAELTADQQGTAIYQDVKVTPGTMMKWSLKHSSATSAYVDKMQVMIGEPYKETAQEATRITSENGNKVGEKMTTISTPTTSDRADNKKWDTYSGMYLVPDGVTTVRFTFKSIASAEWYSGNDLDDIEFSRSYKLTYDKNSSDAAGEVPSNQRGKENTTQPARTRTSGTVRTVADDAAGRTVLECKQSGEGATGPYADNFCWIDWSNLPLSRTGEPIPVRINVPGGHIDADATITHTNNAALAAKDFIGSKWSRLTSAYKLTGNTALAFSGRMGRQDPAASVTFSNITPSADRTDTGVNVLKDFRLAFGDAEVMSGGVLQGHDVYEQTDIESDKTLEKLGMIGSGDPNQSYSKANTGYGTTHVTLAGGPKGATDDVNKDSKGSAVVGAKQASQFKVSFKQVNQHWDGWGSAIAVGVYMPYLTAYPLTYDKNASDATGEVPSNQRGRENTTQPAKDKTSGTVRLASDDDVVEYAANGLPKQIMNGDFDHDWRNTVKQAKAKSSGGVRLAADRTDGKVSDLVQRTTTHEDGSVTVRTVDTTTDVVSGCQVYYPAGQKITLATLAKDDDCWDSSMLTRPGHTQLGWNQDRNATAAQPEVTMVEGGMTVYAVWVGNPVLTYDTNKPNTWNGQMPSTPASVSVSYNTAAADGSGWQSGDTSKIRGYRFLGWYAGPQDDAGLYDWNTLLTGNVTVYAHWERLKASVVYDRNAKDAKGSHANTTGWQYSDVTVPSDTSKSFKRDGYVFLGWDTQADGNGTAYKDGSQVPLQDKDITLYAQWQPVFEQFTPTGGVSLPLLVAGGVTLLMMGIGSTVMLTRRMRGEQ